MRTETNTCAEDGAEDATEKDRISAAHSIQREIERFKFFLMKLI